MKKPFLYRNVVGDEFEAGLIRFIQPLLINNTDGC